MQELIKVERDENLNGFISGRELHMFLEVKTQYTKWFERMCEYGFEENIDFRAISQKRLIAQGNETTWKSALRWLQEKGKFILLISSWQRMWRREIMKLIQEKSCN